MQLKLERLLHADQDLTMHLMDIHLTPHVSCQSSARPFWTFAPDLVIGGSIVLPAKNTTIAGHSIGEGNLQQRLLKTTSENAARF